MIIPAPDDVAFRICGIAIYWYGIIMASAIFVSITLANNLYNRTFNNLQKDIILDFAPYFIIIGILGARLYYCLLNPQYYFSNPIEILDIREGGLSIHGAIIAGVFCIYLMSKKYKISFLNLADITACATILGQSIGRWGNYFNSEAYGLPIANQNWGLFIPSSKRIAEYINFSLFHPTFLYESILDLTAFFVLLTILKVSKNKYPGVTFFSYLIIYSIIRFFVEQLRVDSALNVNNYPIAAIVSCFMFFIGFVGLIICITKQTNK